MPGTLVVALLVCSAMCAPLQGQLREDGTTDRRLLLRDTDVATGDCQAVTLSRLRATYVGGGAVVWDTTARAQVSFNHMVSVRGTGLVQEPSQQGWRVFTYECAFMYQTRQSVMRLRVDSTRFVPKNP